MAEVRTFEWNEELDEILEDLEPVDRQEWRHGHKAAYVFERDGAHWKAWICVHTQEGWERSDTLRATRVVPREKTVIEWVPASADTPSDAPKEEKS